VGWVPRGADFEVQSCVNSREKEEDKETTYLKQKGKHLSGVKRVGWQWWLKNRKNGLTSLGTLTWAQKTNEIKKSCPEGFQGRFYKPADKEKARQPR